MARSTTTKTVTSFLVAIGMIVILAAFAVVAAGTTGDRPAPSAVAPTPAPTVTPLPVPSEPPQTEAPSDPFGSGIGLDVADDHEVVVVIANASDTVIGARSGVAGDGMSARWGDVIVENVDEDTLRLTWSGWLEDGTVTVAVAAEADALYVTVTQKMPVPDTDAMGGDRVLVLDLAQPFDADAVHAEVVSAE